MTVGALITELAKCDPGEVVYLAAGRPWDVAPILAVHRLNCALMLSDEADMRLCIDAIERAPYEIGRAV